MGQLDDLLKGLGGKQGGEGGGIGDLIGGLAGGGSGAGGGGLAAMLPMLAPVVGKLIAGGGLQKILASLQEQGQGDKASSWVSTGSNEPISPVELRRAVGDDAVRDAARRAGVSEEEAASGLAALLPDVVDRLSPDGTLPDQKEVDRAAGKLERVGAD